MKNFEFSLEKYALIDRQANLSEIQRERECVELNSRPRRVHHLLLLLMSFSLVFRRYLSRNKRSLITRTRECARDDDHGDDDYYYYYLSRE